MRPKELDKLMLNLENQPSAELDRRITALLKQAAKQGPSPVLPELALWRRIMESKYTKIAAAAVLIVGIFVLADHLLGKQEPQPQPEQTVAQETSPPAEHHPEPVGPSEQPPLMQPELEQAKALFVQRNTEGLLTLLENGQYETKLKVADYLGQIGDASAIPKLQMFVEQWQGPETENPFLLAIQAIQARLSEPKESKDKKESTPSVESKAIKDVETVEDRCQGAVVSQSGRRVAHATVVLYYDGVGDLDDRVLAKTTSDAQGKFSFKTEPLFVNRTEHAYHRDKNYLIASHPDHALGWYTIHDQQQQTHYEITVTDPRSHVITVVDSSDRPLPNARVWVYDAGDREGSDPLFKSDLWVTKDIGINGVTTNQQGQAHFRNLPPTKCSFYASLEGYARTLAFPGQARIRLTPGGSVKGRIVDADGHPAQLAVVRLAAEWMNGFFWVRTNSQGEFVFKDLPAAGWDMSAWGQGKTGNGKYVLTVKHDQLSVPNTTLSLEPGELVDDLLLTAYAETTLVHCGVISADLGERLAGARISGNNEIGRINGYSDAEGVFHVRVLPGDTSLWFHSPPDGVYTLDGTNPPGGSIRFKARGDEMTVVVKSPPIAGYLTTVSGQVQAYGGPVSDAKVYAAANTRFDTATTVGNYIRPVSTDALGHFTLKQVPAGLDVHIYAETKDHSLACHGTYHVPDDPVGNPLQLALILEPTADEASVTIENSHGELAANARIDVCPKIAGFDMWRAERRIQTDEFGTLTMNGVVPGLTYRIRDHRFDSNNRASQEERSTWVNTDMVLLPVPAVEGADQ